MRSRAEFLRSGVTICQNNITSLTHDRADKHVFYTVIWRGIGAELYCMAATVPLCLILTRSYSSNLALQQSQLFNRVIDVGRRQSYSIVCSNEMSLVHPLWRDTDGEVHIVQCQPGTITAHIGRFEPIMNLVYPRCEVSFATKVTSGSYCRDIHRCQS